jgi:hypothetical protein
MENLSPSFEPPHFLVRFVVGKPHEHVGGNYVPILGFKQWASYSCGYAATAMVLSHFRPEVNLETLYGELGTDTSGTRQTAIVNTLRNYGLSVLIKRSAAYEDLVKAFDAGKLVIVYDSVNEHWMTAYGYQKNGLLLIADPAPCEEFKYPFSGGLPFEGFALIISEKGRKNVV